MEPPALSADKSDPSSRPLLEMQDIDISFGGVAALRQRRSERGRRRSACADRPERRRQIDHDQDPHRRLSARLAGTMRFEGREVDFRTPKEAREAGISTIYQEINLVPFRSVAENIFLGREPRRFGLIDWRAVRAKRRALLESFGLQIDVEEAGAPTIRPPSSRWSRSPARCRRMRRWSSWTNRLPRSTNAKWSCCSPWCASLRDDGRAVIFVSHRLDELYALCDRVTVMRDGQTVAKARWPSMDKLQLVTTMLGRTLAAVVQEDSRGAARRISRSAAAVVAGRKGSSRARIRKSATSRSKCTRAKPSASRACSARAARRRCA